MNYHELQADLLDRIGTVKADAEQHLLNSIMLSSMAIAIASEKAPDYRPATRDAVNFARQAYRHVCALVSREDFRRLMANSKTSYKPNGNPSQDQPFMVLGRSHVGD